MQVERPVRARNDVDIYLLPVMPLHALGDLLVQSGFHDHAVLEDARAQEFRRRLTPQHREHLLVYGEEYSLGVAGQDPRGSHLQYPLSLRNRPDQVARRPHVLNDDREVVRDGVQDFLDLRGEGLSTSLVRQDEVADKILVVSD